MVYIRCNIDSDVYKIVEKLLKDKYFESECLVIQFALILLDLLYEKCKEKNIDLLECVYKVLDELIS